MSSDGVQGEATRLMVGRVGYFRSKVEQTATIGELAVIHSDITIARLSESDYTQLYYDLVAQRLRIIKRLREKALAELKVTGNSVP